MKPLKQSLFRQLISIAVIMIGIVFISLGIIVPKALIPIYEKSIYQQLKQPLELITTDLDDNEILTNIAYIFITHNNEVITSANIEQIVPLPAKQILNKIDKEYGKFIYLGKNYYYHTSYSDYIKKISITNNNYIIQMRQEIIFKIFPIILITILLIIIVIIWWARRLIIKIEFLKNKVDNIDNDDFIDNKDIVNDTDELHSLSLAIDNMKLTLKEQDEFKNQMYQNISHDFKTPLTVIKSYIEAIDDGVENQETASKIIKEQIIKLEAKVHSLLYLNKLNYIKEIKNYQNKLIDVSPIIKASFEKFKIIRPDVKWELVIGDKKTIFNGTEDMWETIIDNLLNNFIRYAENHIKVTIKKGRINLYNDGPNLDDEVLNNLFTPYKKGIKGQFGLGLSIVKKTLFLFGYEVTIKNEKKGVNFIIK